MKGLALRGSAQLGIEGAVTALTGYVAVLILARSLGPAEFGLYGVIISFVVWLERTTLLGIPSAVTKLIAQGEEGAASTSLSVCLALIALVTAALLVAAPFLARLFQAPEQVTLFRVAALDLPLYGLVMFYRGVAIGRHRFARVLASGLALGVVKVAAIAWVVVAGYGLFGALVAYATGSLAGLLVLLIYFPIKLALPDRRIARTVIAMAVPLALSGLGLSILHNLDLWLLKALSPPELASDVGIYAAVRFLARTPEMVLLPIGTVLFPLVASALATSEHARVSHYIRSAMRVLWLVLLPTVTFVAVDAEPIIRFFFSSSYAGGGPLLSIQVAAFGLLTTASILLALLNARGDFYTTVVAGLAMVAALFLSALLVVPRYGAMGAALSFVAVVAAGFVLSAALVHRRFGAFMSVSVIFKGAVATGVLLPGVIAVSASGPWLIAKYVVVFVGYAGLLLLLKELRRDELRPIFSWV